MITLKQAAQQALDYIRSTADYKMGHSPACEVAVDLADALVESAEQQETVVCERCKELEYNKVKYCRLYEQAYIDLQKLNKQKAVVEIKISYSDLEGKVI
jgi:bisphosphoglycerate-dependent phosphoglycerate mutase